MSDEHDQDQQADRRPFYTHWGQPRGHYRSAEDGSPVWVPPAACASDDEINANIAKFLERQEQHPPMIYATNRLSPEVFVPAWCQHVAFAIGLVVGLAAGVLLCLYWPH